MSGITIQPLQADLPFGVRITGVDRNAVEDPRVRQQINDAFELAGVIIFAGVEPSNELQVAVSTIFGPLKEHPVTDLKRVEGDDLKGIIVINSPPDSGGIVEVGGKRLSHWLPWHFDHCYNDELNKAGVLRAAEIVPVGGITGFADGIALYNAFPKELLSRIEGRDILYTLAVQYDDMRFGRPAGLAVVQPKPTPPGFAEQASSMPRALHPAVWTRPSGEKVLHVSPWMAQAISGQETPEGDALLEEVCQEVRRLAAAFSYHHTWQHTDLVIWDNRRMLHSVSGHDPSLGRTMIRTTIQGDYGLGRFEGQATGGNILRDTMV